MQDVLNSCGVSEPFLGAEMGEKLKNGKSRVYGRTHMCTMNGLREVSDGESPGKGPASGLSGNCFPQKEWKRIKFVERSVANELFKPSLGTSATNSDESHESQHQVKGGEK